MDVFLRTERLVLRRFTTADADLLVELDSDPEVVHYVTGGVPTSREDVVDDFLPAFLSYYDRYPGFGFWAALERTTGEFLGWFHLRPAPEDPADEVELGYRLRRAAWGRGYATEGCRALIAKAFTELGVRRVYAETMAVHAASRTVMKRAGLHYVRTFHQPWPYPIPGEELGDVEYALTRDEWQQQSAATTSATDDSISATRVIDAAAAAVFAVLADPAMHAAIDGTGWVSESLGSEPLTAPGQIFRMAMYHLKHPDGNYEIANRVQLFVPPRIISWEPGYQEPGYRTDDGTLAFGGWIWRYDLTPVGPDKTTVRLTYDWSAVSDPVREHIGFPPFPAQHLENSLGHLAELVPPAGR